MHINRSLISAHANRLANIRRCCCRPLGGAVCTDMKVMGYQHPDTTAVRNAYIGGVYSPIQNRIYLVPFGQAEQDTWHYINCETGQVVGYEHPRTTADYGAYRGGVYSPKQNRIYLVPYRGAEEDTWHFIDCNNQLRWLRTSTSWKPRQLKARIGAGCTAPSRTGSTSCRICRLNKTPGTSLTATTARWSRISTVSPRSSMHTPAGCTARPRTGSTSCRIGRLNKTPGTTSTATTARRRWSRISTVSPRSGLRTPTGCTARPRTGSTSCRMGRLTSSNGTTSTARRVKWLGMNIRAGRFPPGTRQAIKRTWAGCTV